MKKEDRMENSVMIRLIHIPHRLTVLMTFPPNWRAILGVLKL